MSVSSELIQDEGSIDRDASVEAIAARSPLQLFWRRLKRDKVALGALVVIVLLVLIAIFANAITGAFGVGDAQHQYFDALDQSSGVGVATGPSSAHPFGVTESVGLDVFSNTVYGLRVSLEVAILSTGLSLVIGLVVGLIAGYYGGWIDTLLSRITDIVLAFPVLLLAIGISSSCSLGSGSSGCLGGLIQPGVATVIFVIALVNWTYIARIVRGQVLSLREKEFVEAARSLGASDRRIIFRHLLPNLVAPLIVYTSLLIPQNILFEAALSFLGVGARDDQSSLGKLISDGLDTFNTSWWIFVFPGVVLLIIVFAFNLVGDGLQDALNPRTARK